MSIYPPRFSRFPQFVPPVISVYATKPYSLEDFADGCYDQFSFLESRALEKRLTAVREGQKLPDIKLQGCSYRNNYLDGFLEFSAVVKGAYVIVQAFNPLKGDEPPIQEMVIMARPDLQRQNADVDLEEVVLRSFQLATEAVVEGWIPERFQIRKVAEGQIRLSGIHVVPLIENLPFPRKIVCALDLESVFSDATYLQETLSQRGIFPERQIDGVYHAHIGGETAYIFSTGV